MLLIEANRQSICRMDAGLLLLDMRRHKWRREGLDRTIWSTMKVEISQRNDSPELAALKTWPRTTEDVEAIRFSFPHVHPASTVEP